MGLNLKLTTDKWLTTDIVCTTPMAPRRFLWELLGLLLCCRGTGEDSSLSQRYKSERAVSYFPLPMKQNKMASVLQRRSVS